MISLALGGITWDLNVGASGNLATAEGDHRLAQDVASAVRTFDGECIFDQDRGVPYFDEVLGHRPQAQLVNAYVEQEAARVPGVTRVLATDQGLSLRTLTGEAVLPMGSILTPNTSATKYVDPNYATGYAE